MLNNKTKRDKKVLFVATVVKTHINSFHLPYLEWFKKHGWETHVAASNDFIDEECFIPNCDEFHNVCFTRSPITIRNISAYRQLKKIIDGNHFDIIHAHTPVGGLLARLAARDARRKGTKVIYTAHGFHFYKGGPKIKNAIYFTAEKIAARWTDHIIVLNQEDYDAAVKYLYPENQVTLMDGIGIDLDNYNIEKISCGAISKIREELKLAREDIMILMIAEFIARKRHKDAIEALVKTGNPDLHLAFAGSGALLEETKRLVQEYGMSKQVHFLGFRKDIPVLIAASRATLLTSEQEGLPRSVMESMALGIPVIGADARGTRDLISDGCGLIYPVGDIKRLSEILNFVALSEEACKDMVEKARIKVRTYDLKRIIREHETIYNNMGRA
ncbi:MAG: glycosyltransferase family 4 protein [Synergistaceae bacterium]|nr:glycosyltransferase family 4 protein [Synergistaceae bacterium]